MKPRHVVALFCSFFSGSNAFAQEAHRPSDSASATVNGVDDYVERVMTKRHVPGVSLAVVKDGRVVLAKGYGLANVELVVPATADTVYQLASVTKTFTATAILMLEKDGKLSLDDKITERLPDLPEAWDGVTVRHLLNHTSGIKSYTSVEGFDKTARKDYSHREILDLVAQEPMEFAPGERWNYCNTGYFLLGMLIEDVTGKPYGEFLAERVFAPLGMDRTRVNDLRAVIEGRAQGYHWDGKALSNGEYVSPSQPFAAGALVSSVADLVKWDAALAGHTLLDEATQERMWAPTKLAEGEAGYGLGWELGEANGHRLVSHGGGIPGFATKVSRFVDDNLTVIVLTNADGGHADQLARGVAGFFVPELAEKAAEPIADSDAPTTDRLRGVLESAQKGEIDSERFTDEANKQLVPLMRGEKDRLAALGTLKTFRLLDRKDSDEGGLLQYRAEFETETLKVTFAIDKAGRIRGIRLQPED